MSACVFAQLFLLQTQAFAVVKVKNTNHYPRQQSIFTSRFSWEQAGTKNWLAVMRDVGCFSTLSKRLDTPKQQKQFRIIGSYGNNIDNRLIVPNVFLFYSFISIQLSSHKVLTAKLLRITNEYSMSQILRFLKKNVVLLKILAVIIYMV